MWQLSKKTLQLCSLFVCLCLCACHHSSYKRIESHTRIIQPMSKDGTTAVIATKTITKSTKGICRSSKKGILSDLEDQSIQYVQYGDTQTLIVPTDKYFLYNSPRINELRYPGLRNIVKLLKLYPDYTVFVAGFSDDVGSRKRKQQLTQAQAEAMLTVLWANGIKAELLHAQGYGDQHPIGDNSLIHGSAFNRRLEIQWLKADAPKLASLRYSGWKK